MGELIELFHNLTDPAWIMDHGGLYIVAFIVFAETGLFVGFFLPGDTILFITGMIIANSLLPGIGGLIPLLYWIAIIAAAGIAGNYMGYWIGSKFGDHFSNKKDTWLFKKRHLQNAKEFYDKKGGSAIIIARFLPIVRTFAPVIAGMVRMKKTTFTIYNVIGSMVWVGSIVTAGYLLGENEWVRNNLDIIVIGIVVVTTTPVIAKALSPKCKTLVKSLIRRK